MQYRTLGKSGFKISAISFGGGPISGLMVGDHQDAQRCTVQAAIDAGINWFDTAATYGEGRSESGLGSAIRTCDRDNDFGVATKVRLSPEELGDIPRAVRASFTDSLSRLGLERVKLLQLHNSITTNRGDLPTSVRVEDVLGKKGVVEAFETLKKDGLIEAFGFTGLGDQRSVSEVVHSGAFTSAQVPFSLLTPFSGPDRSAGSIDVDYEQLIDECAANHVGVIAIRVFAGGALVGQQPSPYTYKTKFFTLDMFQRDQLRTMKLQDALPDGLSMAEATVRFVLNKPGVTTALIGFATPDQINDALCFASRGAIEPNVWSRIRQIGGKLQNLDST